MYAQVELPRVAKVGGRARELEVASDLLQRRIGRE